MRIVAALLMVCLLAVPCYGEWIEGSIIGVDANAPRSVVLARIYWGNPQGWVGSATAILTWNPPPGFTGAPDQPQGEDVYDPSPYAPTTSSRRSPASTSATSSNRILRQSSGTAHYRWR